MNSVSPIVLFVDEKIEIPDNAHFLFEECKKRRGNCGDLSFEMKRYTALEEIDPGENVWVLARNGNGFRMTKTRRFTPAWFKSTTPVSEAFKKVVVVDPDANKNPEGMLTNVFAWVVKTSTNGANGQPFYGAQKKPRVQIPYTRTKKKHHFDGGAW